MLKKLPVLMIASVGFRQTDAHPGKTIKLPSRESFDELVRRVDHQPTHDKQRKTDLETLQTKLDGFNAKMTATYKKFKELEIKVQSVKTTLNKKVNDLHRGRWHASDGKSCDQTCAMIWDKHTKAGCWECRDWDWPTITKNDFESIWYLKQSTGNKCQKGEIRDVMGPNFEIISKRSPPNNVDCRIFDGSYGFHAKCDAVPSSPKIWRMCYCEQKVNDPKC